MYHCQFSIDELKEIERQRYCHSDPIVRKRMTILWHKHNALSHREIAKLSGAATNTVTATIKTYLDKGLVGVQERKFYCPASQLDPYRSQLMAHFSVCPPRTLKEAAAEIEQITGFSFTLSHVRNVLLSFGLSRKKREVFLGNSMMPSEKSKKTFLAIR
jgi:transposase